jgi:hypothetical protein
MALGTNALPVSLRAGLTKITVEQLQLKFLSRLQYQSPRVDANTLSESRNVKV